MTQQATVAMASAAPRSRLRVERIHPVSLWVPLHAKGGHAFGLRRTEYPITEWPQLLPPWLRTIGMISE